MKYVYRLLYFIITWLHIIIINSILLIWHFDLKHKINYEDRWLLIETIKDNDIWVDIKSEMKLYERLLR